MFDFSAAADKHRRLIFDAHDYIWHNAETGYREVKTTKYLADAFEKLGYEVHLAEGITGFYTVLDTGREGPELLILGELDSLICPDHPEADKQTGAVHCCGHSAQCAALLGIAAALKEPHALDELSGRIRLCAIPAEEGIETEYRKELIRKGVIKYTCGKSEFLRRGYFDGVDLAFMIHSTNEENFFVRYGSVGNIKKLIKYTGVAAHAGSAPWNGVNALYAANLGLSAINSLRETFKEEDLIRVHPIITEGGVAANAIPDTVKIEGYVRGKTYTAISEANKKVNRALIGGALSLGANITITDTAGSSPLVNDMNMVEIAKRAAEKIGERFIVKPILSTGSTDMGDLSSIMPVVHPYAAGATGIAHGKNYYITDVERCCVGSAKMQLEMLQLLLSGNAAEAKRIIAEFKPQFASKTDFLDFLDSLNTSDSRITYTEEGAQVTL